MITGVIREQRIYCKRDGLQNPSEYLTGNDLQKLGIEELRKE